MKEFLKKYFFGFILAAVVVGPFSYVTATTIAARNITYNGTNTNSSLTDVQAAIEELYDLSEPKISFTIDGVTYKANVGMTWAEWIMSSFNTDNYTFLIGYETSTIVIGHVISASTQADPITCSGYTFYHYRGQMSVVTSVYVGNDGCNFNSTAPTDGGTYSVHTEGWSGKS